MMVVVAVSLKGVIQSHTVFQEAFSQFSDFLKMKICFSFDKMMRTELKKIRVLKGIGK